MHRDSLDLRGKIIHLSYEISQLAETLRMLEDHLLKEQILEVVERKAKELQILTKKL